MSLFLNPKVIVLAVLASLAPFAIDTYLPGFHIIATDLSSTPAYVQQSLTFYLIPYTIMTLFHGAISDSIGRITTIKWGLALFFFASIGCVFSTSIEELWFFRALQGIGGGAGNVVARAMVRDLYKGAQAQRVMATIQIIFGIAPAVAPIFGGFLLDYGWQSIFAFLAFYAGIAIYFSSRILPETMPVKLRLPFNLKSISTRYRSIFKDKEFVLLILALSANFSAFFLYVLASPIFLIDLLGFSEKQFAYLFIPTVCGMVVGSFIAKQTAGAISPSKLTKYGYFWMFLIALSNVIFCYFFENDAMINIGFIALYNVGMASIMPIISIAALDCFPKTRGTAASGQAFMQMFFSSVVAGVIVPICWFSTFGLSLGLFFILILGLFFITRTKLWVS
ncbi:MAG: multidrug effflux MFS transporter [Nitrosomonadales bacterium]|jgi:DHA1 family bicyclomycin/chloramphenicol resistance-like MFS transporter|nr:multidrug effflux MFS transporter [Nitrosomonadales bacterium]MBT4182949.1 multidrug effflux MFS transporter [Nitrosomonadales bacterium]MBT4571502.1 multidrug effflux MFS transporter [Nitrosomonadales bacterium]MBT5150520.1 multidrug effflux MFS transporter [Nitrosomonadales bacterium]MBT5573614.1 multidrug effflux MFS transporter [Nitrosomonadales bacterium]